MRTRVHYCKIAEGVVFLASGPVMHDLVICKRAAERFFHD
jgi:hypothetical protein